MITTQFLTPGQLKEYGYWLKAQDPETIHEYFGCALNEDIIDGLIKKIASNSAENHILVAKSGIHWLGTIHIATHENSVEFGIIVGLANRNQGIATQMMDEAIIWARNRFYTNLYMHCIYRNTAIRKLCDKHHLEVKNMMGDSEGNLILPPPTPLTFFKEQIAIVNQNWARILQFGQTSF